MLSNVFLKSLRDLIRPLMFWGTGVFLYGLVIVLFYPTISEVPGLNEIWAEDSALSVAFGGGDLTSPEGFLNAEVFSFMWPLLFMIFSVWVGTASIAGEERRGTLEILLALPITRSSIVLQKSGVIFVANILLGLSGWIGLAVGFTIISVDVDIFVFIPPIVMLALLGSLLGTMALLIGSSTGKTGLAIGVTATVGTVAYLLNTLGQLVDGLEWIRYGSPLYYYSGANPLANGLSLGHSVVMVCTVIVFISISMIVFNKRDINA